MTVFKGDRMIKRFSSRIENIHSSFLTKRLTGAKSYDRIAGYFNSSILDIAGEALESVGGEIRIVCNSGVSLEDAKTARMVKESVRNKWCEFKPELLISNTENEELKKDLLNRFKKLYNLLKSGKMKIRVIPDDEYGMIHGKAGVITLKDGKKTAFLGSANETYSGWVQNYELLWEDDSQEAVEWVQNEFNTLWNNKNAIDLPDFIIKDIGRISKRKLIYDIEEWREDPKPASTVIESPIYRQENGLWDFQKYFVEKVFKAHQKPYGARFILADMVGLGKTIQLAVSALLMALYGEKPILIIVPKTLIGQWQDELITLLDIPTAVWDGKAWVDETGTIHKTNILNCPRKIGIVSQGLFMHKSKHAELLLNQEYECVIVYEAHKARRKDLRKGCENRHPTPNNLMGYLLELSKKTKSMFLATATPVQLYPVEIWDLLHILAEKNDSVLGNKFSKWRKYKKSAILLTTGQMEIPKEDWNEYWEWIRNPLPPSEENPKTFGVLRDSLGMDESEFVVNEFNLSRKDKRKIEMIIEDDFFRLYNPLIRHVIRRTREYLENTINLETGEPYLKKIKINLHGESDDESIVLTPYLKEAYECAEKFCESLGKRALNGGILKTLLLRRVGSTMIAGETTARNMLGGWTSECLDEEDDDETYTKITQLTDKEKEYLNKFIKILSLNKDKDPKYHRVWELLVKEKWLEKGCIIFTQYYDSARWIASELSKDLPHEKIGLYAGGNKSCIITQGIEEKTSRDELKLMVKNGKIRLIVGTDSASEGLNLQRLGTLINLDLPWNPTRLEQRKGRIQRIGQIHDEIEIYNMRYKDSVEDRVHNLLSERLEHIHKIFGQIPDILEDVWVKVAEGKIEDAKRRLDDIEECINPFDEKYQKVETVDWESCSEVLDRIEKKKCLMSGWSSSSSN